MVAGSVYLGQKSLVTFQKKGESGSVAISAFISGFDESGFDRDFKYEPEFGTTMVSKGRLSPGTVRFDMTFPATSGDNPLDPLDFSYERTSGTPGEVSVYELSSNVDRYKVKMEFYSFDTGERGNIQPEDASVSIIYYDCIVQPLEFSADAEDRLVTQINLFVPPLNSVGSSNKVIIDKPTGKSYSGVISEENAADTARGY